MKSNQRTKPNQTVKSQQRKKSEQVRTPTRRTPYIGKRINGLSATAYRLLKDVPTSGDVQTPVTAEELNDDLVRQERYNNIAGEPDPLEGYDIDLLDRVVIPPSATRAIDKALNEDLKRAIAQNVQGVTDYFASMTPEELAEMVADDEDDSDAEWRQPGYFKQHGITLPSKRRSRAKRKSMRPPTPK